MTLASRIQAAGLLRAVLWLVVAGPFHRVYESADSSCAVCHFTASAKLAPPTDATPDLPAPPVVRFEPAVIASADSPAAIAQPTARAPPAPR